MSACKIKTQIFVFSGRTLLAFILASVVGKNPGIPNLSQMAYDAITQDGVAGQGPLVYIHGFNWILTI